ncbi:uncharacterized protein LOC118188733 [Stegodyphus dumicola]|uniref:uncharacterized protein LOC118188733 n=1 Tax=Stegodyphus dumicola TaxID=202533 RepID=UPI0015AD46DE|nr:uncharacterized protein LOC118188733 [Stegodyphus dumicola]
MNNIKILQVNLQHSRGATAYLRDYIESNNEYTIACIQEPYVKDNKVRGFPIKYRKFYAKSGAKTAIIITDNQTSVLEILSTETISAIRIEGQIPFILISVYCPPSQGLETHLSILEDLISDYQNIPVIISGDFDAKHTIWGPSQPDPRGLQICEFLASTDMCVINDPDSPPTFTGARGNSWIDLTLLRKHGQLNIINWKVLEEANLSDHNIITYEISNTKCNRSSKTKMKLKHIDWLKFRLILKEQYQVNRLVSINNIDDHIERTTSLIHETYESTKKPTVILPPHRISKPWWTPELTILRKKVRALRRRYNRSPDSIRTELRKTYKLEQAKYKRLLFEVKRKTWNTFWDNLQISSPFGTYYDIAKGKSLGPLQLSVIEKADGTTTKTIEDSIKEILKFHFPQDPTDQDTEEHKRIRQIANSPCLTKNDKDFTKIEIRKAIETTKRG